MHTASMNSRTAIMLRGMKSEVFRIMVFLFTLFCSVCLSAQTNNSVESDIKLKPDSLSLNSQVDILLITNKKDSVWLTVRNLSPQELLLPNKVRECFPSVNGFVMYCISDSLLRTGMSKINFADTDFYQVAEYANQLPHKMSATYSYWCLSSKPQKDGVLSISPYSEVKLLIPHYVRGKCMFVRYFSVAKTCGQIGYIQIDTNSIYMP